MAKIDIDGDGKADFSISLPQIITLVTLIVTMAGSYYNLNSKLNAAEAAIKKLKENEQKYTWPAQRKLETEVQEMRVEFKAVMKDIEFTTEKINSLNRQVANKKDKK